MNMQEKNKKYAVLRCAIRCEKDSADAGKLRHSENIAKFVENMRHRRRRYITSLPLNSMNQLITIDILYGIKVRYSRTAQRR